MGWRCTPSLHCSNTSHYTCKLEGSKREGLLTPGEKAIAVAEGHLAEPVTFRRRILPIYSLPTLNQWNRHSDLLLMSFDVMQANFIGWTQQQTKGQEKSLIESIKIIFLEHRCRDEGREWIYTEEEKNTQHRRLLKLESYLYLKS